MVRQKGLCRPWRDLWKPVEIIVGLLHIVWLISLLPIALHLMLLLTLFRVNCSWNIHSEQCGTFWEVLRRDLSSVTKPFKVAMFVPRVTGNDQELPWWSEMDSWNHPEEIGTSHLQCWHREWTDGEATHRSVASKRSPTTQVYLKHDRRLLLLWTSYACSRSWSSSGNSSKTVRGRTMLSSTTASSSNKAHAWKLSMRTKRGSNYTKGGGMW